MPNIKKMLNALHKERDVLKKKLGEIEKAIEVLSNAEKWEIFVAVPAKKRRGMSAAGRRKISQAQKARWKKTKATKKS